MAIVGGSVAPLFSTSRSVQSDWNGCISNVCKLAMENPDAHLNAKKRFIGEVEWRKSKGVDSKKVHHVIDVLTCLN